MEKNHFSYKINYYHKVTNIQLQVILVKYLFIQQLCATITFKILEMLRITTTVQNYIYMNSEEKRKKILFDNF